MKTVKRIHMANQPLLNNDDREDKGPFSVYSDTYVKVQLVNRIQHLANAWTEFVNLVYFIGPQVPMFNPCQTSVEFY